MQAPLQQSCELASQELPHPPQLFMSDCRSTQVLPQQYWVPVHAALVPHMQAWVAPPLELQELPLVQMQPETVLQTPLWHAWPVEQVLPHWPQLARSLERSKQPG